MASNRPPFPPLKVNPHEAFFTAAILCRYNHSSMAQTPWGELAIQDAHVHFFSHKFYSALAQQKKAANAEALAPLLNFEIPTAAPAELADRWAVELTRSNVQRAALIASLPGDEESVSAAVAAHPDRFYGYFMLDPTQPDALARVKLAAANPHLHCLCLFPAMHTYSLTDPRLVPILEVCSDHRLVVFVHCGAISMGVRKKLGLASQFNLRYSNPIDLHPVALHFPLVRFVIPHFGAGLLREALMVADLCPNVFFDTSSSNRWMIYEGLDLPEVFRRSIEVLSVNRLLFGSDSSFFPRGWHAAVLDQQAKALYELGLDAQQASQILCSNLEQLHMPRLLLSHDNGTQHTE
jgi:predicted TIM-barrel fold metal-dependent hydrolase